MLVLKCKKNAPVQKNYYIIADSDEMRNEWYQAIRNTITSKFHHNALFPFEIQSSPPIDYEINLVEDDNEEILDLKTSSIPEETTPTEVTSTPSEGSLIEKQSKEIQCNELNHSDLPINALPSKNDTSDRIIFEHNQSRASFNNMLKPLDKQPSGSLDFQIKELNLPLNEISDTIASMYDSINWKEKINFDENTPDINSICPNDNDENNNINKSLESFNQTDYPRRSLSIQLVESLNDPEIFEEFEKQMNELENIKDEKDKIVESPKRGFVAAKIHPSKTRNEQSNVSTHRNLTQKDIYLLIQESEAKRIEELKEELISKENPLDIYECDEKCIGKGGMGEVFVGIKYSTKEQVAIKKLPTSFKGKNRLPTILNEINVMAHSHHENIVNYIASYHLKDELWVCMEYMDKGSLYDLVKLRTKIDEKYMAYIVQSILRALKFIHELKRIHRDIKVDNVLISSSGDIKLADFGAAVQLTFQRLKRSTMTGTPYYMSPEIISGQQYDELVDIWSLGILCIELSMHEPPYYDLSPELALEKIVTQGVEGIPPKQFSNDFVDFVNNRCLQVLPSKRWSSSKLLEHPWLNRACSKKEFSNWLKNVKGMDSVKSQCQIL